MTNFSFFQSAFAKIQNNNLIHFAHNKLTKKSYVKRLNPNTSKGNVYLVGSGCGDAELLTLKAYRLIQEADVVMYDWLVSTDIVDMIPTKTEKVFVGKKCGHHHMTQSQICNLLSETALAGKNVVRLKGGDPSIFGRAAEEIEELQKHNIEFAIVPGVTAASGCAAWSGIPLTHRDCAHSLRFVTAHFKNEHIEADWQNLADSEDTIVFYMGLSRIEKIAQLLQQYGKDKHTPMAIIDQGTTAQQQTYVATLDTIKQKLENVELVGPALIVVGEAINYRANVNVSLLDSQYGKSELIDTVA